MQRIVIVEEDNDLLNVLSGVIRKNFGRVAECRSINAARKFLENDGDRAGTQLVIVSHDKINPPTGLDFCHEIKEKWPKIRTLLTTSGACPLKHPVEGPVAVLQKPFTNQELIDSIKEALQPPR